MASILKNPLVDGIFKIICDKEESSESLFCEPCKTWSKVQTTPIKLGHEGSMYSVWKSGIKRPMEKWFSNLKITIFRHLISDSHHRCVDSEFGFQAKNSSVKENIFQNMRHISYFVLKSNLPFEQFPSLLATANCCGLELGDLNHSRHFINKFLEVVNEELLMKTTKWFEEQKDITITLDIGKSCSFIF